MNRSSAQVRTKLQNSIVCFQEPGMVGTADFLQLLREGMMELGSADDTDVRHKG